MEKKYNISICFSFKKTGRCSLKSTCPNAKSHRRCGFFLFGKCENKQCPFFHDFAELIKINKGETCEDFKKTGKCAKGNSCRHFAFHKKCKYFITKKCTKNNECPFFHDNEEKKKFQLSSKDQSQICQFYMKNTCKFGNSCRDLHICSFFIAGTCKFGGKCNFSHEKKVVNNVPSNIEENDQEEFDDAVSVHTEAQSVVEEKGEDFVCCVCYENPSTHAIVPCGHNIYCEDCVVKLRKCAKCRGPIQSVIKIFK